MAGNLTVEQCGRLFQTRQACSNYGIGTDGRVGMYCEEGDRAWCSANFDNDHRAINIEVANDGGEPDWHVSDTALNKLIDLCVDICQRNGISELIYTGDTDGNLTRHNMFTATVCPGPYLQSKFPWIAATVNERLNMDSTKYVLKIGYASLGDIRTFINLLVSFNVGCVEENGYITTKELTGSQKAAVEAKAKELGVPCVVVSEEKDEDPDYKTMYLELKADFENYKKTIRTISDELSHAVI